jgi:hypothetical protein
LIIDITNEIFDTLESSLTGVTVLPSYPETTPSFPCVIVEEISNTSLSTTHDSAGDHHSEVSIEINIFTTGDTKTSDAKTIRNSVDSILSGTFNMSREESAPMPNYADSGIYRYVCRYSAIVDSNRTIFRG